MLTSARNAGFEYRLFGAALQQRQEIPDILRLRSWERGGVQHNSSTDRDHRRKLAEDETVSGYEQCGLGQTELCITTAARRNLLRFVEAHFCNRFHSEGVQVHAGAVFEGLGGWQHRKRDVESRGGVKSIRQGQRHAARKIVGG